MLPDECKAILAWAHARAARMASASPTASTATPNAAAAAPKPRTTKKARAANAAEKSKTATGPAPSAAAPARSHRAASKSTPSTYPTERGLSDPILAACLRLVRTRDAFDRFDIDDECGRRMTDDQVTDTMAKLVGAGLAQVSVRGGYWVPPEGGPAKARPTLWIGTGALR